MSKKNPTTWSADPHTLAKIAILKNYLNAWFPIFASTFSGQIVYIDGFAGPGSYTNHDEGSPPAALSIFKSWICDATRKWKFGELVVVLIEGDPKRFDLLRTRVAEFEGTSKLRILPFNGEFAPVMDSLIADKSLAPGFSGGQPLLVFADPFGATGVPFRIFQHCLTSPASELLLNFDADGIARIFKGQNNKWIEQLDELFGNDTWKQVLNGEGVSLGKLAEKCLILYKKRLSEIPGVEYVWAFEMKGKSDKTNYYLVFASRSRHGMLKMKEAMKALDATGSFQFSDAYVDQHVLFRDDNEEHFADRMHNTYEGKSLGYGELDRYALCETPFLNPKKMLACLARDERIAVTYKEGAKVRTGYFPEDSVECVTFRKRRSVAVQADLF